MAKKLDLPLGQLSGSKGIHAMGIPKKRKSRVPDIDLNDEMYEVRPDLLEQDLKNSPIPLYEQLKHYQYHNADYSIWLDIEFGVGREGFIETKGLKDGTYREFFDSIEIPDVTQWVRINSTGKGVRDIGICTAGKLKEVKELIAKSSRLEPMMDKQPQFWPKKKEVMDSSIEIKAVK